MIPQSFVDDLLTRVDIVEVVGRAVQLRKGGINYLGLCPFHAEKSPSFTVSPSKQFYHCFGCGAHGTAIGFLMEHGGESFPDAVRDLAATVGMSVPDDEEFDPKRAQRRAESVALTEILGKASAFYKQQLKGSPRAIEYLKGRGLTGAIAARFGLGYAPDRWDGLKGAFANYEQPELVAGGLVIAKDAEGTTPAKRYDRFRDRIMFPIRNPRGDVIGFGGRILDVGEPKYLNSPETPVFQKGSELYGLFEARGAIRDRGYALVVEGYMDVVALAQSGIENAVATLGTASSAIHVQKLMRQTDRIVFSFDGDSAGRKAAWRALEASLPHAQDGKLLSFLFLPAEHDPDSFVRAEGPEAFEQAVAAAWPLSTFLLNHLGEDKNLNTAEGRASLVHDAGPLLKQLPQGALRLQIAQALAEAAATPVEAVAAAGGFRMPSRSGGFARAPRPVARRAPVIGLEQRIARLLWSAPAVLADLEAEDRAALREADGAIGEFVRAIDDATSEGIAPEALVEIVDGLPSAETLRDWLAGRSGDAEVRPDAPDDVRLELDAAARQWRLQENDRAQRRLLEAQDIPDSERVERLVRLRVEAERLRRPIDAVPGAGS